MKKCILLSRLICVIFVLQLLFCNQISAQNQEECFDYNKTAFFTGLWFGDGETRFDDSKLIDGIAYHRGKMWAIKEYREQVVEAFGSGFGIEGIFFDLERYENIKKGLTTIPPPSSQEKKAIEKKLNNINFWVNPQSPFKDFDPNNSRNSSPIIPAPAQLVNTRSEVLSWMMGVIYTEGFRGGRIIDDRGNIAQEKMQKAFDLIKTAGFETATLTREDNNTKTPKYAIRIKEPDFKIVQALPFRRWNRVPGMPASVNGAKVLPPSDVDQYPSCVAGLSVNGLNHQDKIIIKNPLNRGDNLIIKLPNGSQTAICKIFDIHGKFIDQFEISDNKHTYAQVVNLSIGLYIVKIFLPGQTQNIKLIIK